MDHSDAGPIQAHDSGHVGSLGQRTATTQPVAVATCLATLVLVTLVNVPNFLTFDIEKFLAHPEDSCQPILPVEGMLFVIVIAC